MYSTRFGLIIVLLMIAMITIHNGQTQAKVMSRCEIAKALKKNKIPMTYVSNWVCLIESESGGDTTKLTKTPLYYTYGIFQISSGEWCGRGYLGGACNINCNNFLTDQIDADIKCATKIFDQHGFKWWKGWASNCKQKTLPNISTCFTR